MPRNLLVLPLCWAGLAACATCHAHQGKGGDLGPDLSHIGSKFDTVAILDSMINPSTAITFGYEATMIRLKDEDEITGFLIGAGDPVIFREAATGEKVSISRKEIESIKPLVGSIMPSVLNLGLGKSELVDLAAFLKTKVN